MKTDKKLHIYEGLDWLATCGGGSVGSGIILLLQEGLKWTQVWYKTF